MNENMPNFFSIRTVYPVNGDQFEHDLVRVEYSSTDYVLSLLKTYDHTQHLELRIEQNQNVIEIATSIKCI